MAEVFGDPNRVRVVLLLKEWFDFFSFKWKIVLFESRYYLICWVCHAVGVRESWTEVARV